MADAPLQVGLVGLGKHGERYLQHIRSDLAGALRIVAISRRDETAGRALAADLGCRFHRDPRDLISNSGVEAVIAVLPPREHGIVVEAAVSAHKPLLIEKPFAITGEEASRLCTLVESASLPCVVAQTLRFASAVQALRERLDAIGPVSQLVLGQSFEPSRLEWLDDPDLAGGGNILHTGVHQFDLLRYLTGSEVEWVSCLTERVATRRTEDSFTAAMSLDGRGGPSALASVSASRATASRYGEVRLLGAHGQLVADHVHRTIALIRDRRVVESLEVPDMPTVRAVLEHFVAVATRGAAPLVTAADGAAAVQIADACYRSARDGRRVAVLGR